MKFVNLRKHWIIGTASLALIGGLSITGISMAEDNHRPEFKRHHHGMSVESFLNDSVIMNRIIEKVVDHVVPDGSAQQKASLNTIVKAAVQDLRPIHEQNKVLKGQVKTLLQQPTLDRNAMEQWRQEEMRLVDTASKRILQAVLDCADILTPEQRVKLAEQLEKRRS